MGVSICERRSAWKRNCMIPQSQRVHGGIVGQKNSHREYGESFPGPSCREGGPAHPAISIEREPWVVALVLRQGNDVAQKSAGKLA